MITFVACILQETHSGSVIAMLWNCILGLILIEAAFATYKSYEGYEVFFYNITTSRQANIISSIERGYSGDAVDVWKHATARSPGMIMMAPEIKRNMTRVLILNGISVKRSQMDISRLIRNQRRENRNQRISNLFLRSRRTMHKYYMRHGEIIDWITRKARACRRPLNCSTQIIGKTIYNRKLTIIKISTGPGKEKVWIDAGIHAREWIAPSTALYIIDKLLTYDADARTMLQRFDFYILPLLNPDGYEFTHTYGRFWRKNLVASRTSECFGVDLNRNWGYHWGGSGASNDPCRENYHGRYAFSELETSAVRNYLMEIRSQVKLFITLHSFGQFILTPFSHRKATYPANIHRLREIGSFVATQIERNSGRFYDVGSAADLLYEAAGGSDDYASAILRIPYTFTLELPDEGRYGFLLPPRFIIQVGREMWTALKEFVDNI